MRLTLLIALIVLLNSSAFGNQTSLGLTATAAVEKFGGDEAWPGLGIRARYRSFGSAGFGYWIHGNFELHPIAPEIIGCLGWKFGGRVFIDVGFGVVASFARKGVSLAAMAFPGIKVGSKFFFALPITFRTDIGIWRMQYMPFVGMYF